jgi:hemerythrin-like domain-containing protein
MMTPIGALMIEHRLIERMVHLLEAHVWEIQRGEPANTDFIDSVLEFVRTYADRCHHGKEEDLLFRELESRPLDAEHKQILRELIQEHTVARQTAARLSAANDRHRKGESGALGEIVASAGELTDLYPRHIEKEDHHFFGPIMDCFNASELADMLGDFWEFDRKLIHERYRSVVDQWEAARRTQGAL